MKKQPPKRVHELARAPVHYRGAKTYYARRVVDRLIQCGLDLAGTEPVFDLCCGSGAVSIELLHRGLDPRRLTMVDASFWGEFWRLAGEGRLDLKRIRQTLSEVPVDRELIRPHMDRIAQEGPGDDPVGRFLCLQAASWRATPIDLDPEGRFLCGGFYSINCASSIIPSPKTIWNRVRGCSELARGVTGIRGRVEAVDVAGIAYLDPPYANTAGYHHDLDLQSVLDHIPCGVLVSEARPLAEQAWPVDLVRPRGGNQGLEPLPEWVTWFDPGPKRILLRCPWCGSRAQSSECGPCTRTAKRRGRSRCGKPLRERVSAEARLTEHVCSECAPWERV